MTTYEPSLKMIKAFFDPETRNVVSLPLAALVLGALYQVEAAIALADRVCDQYLQLTTDDA